LAGHGSAALRENDGINRFISDPLAKPGAETSGLCAFGLRKTEEEGETTMNANAVAAWRWLPQAVSRRWKRRQLGFVLYEAGRRPGMEPRVANAHARFEYHARQAAREWLMV
jgi:hypothetical protein